MPNPEQTPQEMPPEREFQYLQNAETVVREATDPVVAKLGEVAVEVAEAETFNEAVVNPGPVEEAEKITADDAKGIQLVDETEKYLSNVVASEAGEPVDIGEDSAAYKASGSLNDKAYYALAGDFNKLHPVTQRRLQAAGYIDEKGETARKPESLPEVAELSDILRHSPSDAEKIASKALNRDFSVPKEEDIYTNIQTPEDSAFGVYNHLSSAERAKLSELDQDDQK